MKALPSMILCLLLAGCAAPPPRPAALPAPAAVQALPPVPRVCDRSLDHMLLRLQKNARYAYTSDAIDNKAQVHMWYINPLTRAWTQIRVYDDLHACVENTGKAWHWTVLHHEPAAKEPAAAEPEAPAKLPQPLRCDRSVAPMLARLGKNLRDGYMGEAVDDRGRRHVMYIDNASRFWTELRVYRDRHACIENSGEDWHWASGG